MAGQLEISVPSSATLIGQTLSSSTATAAPAFGQGGTIAVVQGTVLEVALAHPLTHSRRTIGRMAVNFSLALLDLR